MSNGSAWGPLKAQVMPSSITLSQSLHAESLSPKRRKPCGSPLNTCTLVGTLCEQYQQEMLISIDVNSPLLCK